MGMNQGLTVICTLQPECKVLAYPCNNSTTLSLYPDKAIRVQDEGISPLGKWVVVKYPALHERELKGPEDDASDKHPVNNHVFVFCPP